jgi:hypothetical protein
LTTSVLQNRDILLSRNTSDAILGIAGSGPFASFVPDGLGTFDVALTASDGCLSDSVVSSVLVSCPGPGPSAQPGSSISVRRSFVLPNVTSNASAYRAGASLNLDRTQSMQLFGQIVLAGAVTNDTKAFAWVFVSVPEGSAYVVSPTGLPSVPIGSGAVVLPPSVYSTSSTMRFSPDALGTFTLLLAVSDGCAVSTATVSVTALIDAVRPPLDADSVCYSSPTPTPCPAIGSSITTTSISFTLILGGVTVAEFLASPDLQVSVARSVAAICGVSQTAVQILGVTPSAVRALLERSADINFNTVSRRVAVDDSTQVAVSVSLPSALSEPADILRIIGLLTAASQSESLLSSILAPSSLQV